MILTAAINGSNFRPEEARAALKAANIGTKIELEADPTNKFDVYAIKVSLCGHHVGYVAAHSKNGLARHKDFHEHFAAWPTATLMRVRETGETRVQITSEPR